MDIIERQTCIRERLLPIRPPVGPFPVGLSLLNGLGEICLGAEELHTAGAAFISRQPLLQRLLDATLQLRIDGGTYRIRIGRDRIDAGRRFRLAGDLIDKVEPDVAARSIKRHHGRQRRQAPAGFFAPPRAEHPVFPHPVQHIGEPLLRARGLSVRAEISRSLRQAGEQRAFLEGQPLRRLTKIAAGRHFDTPGAAAEIDGVQIDFEDLILAERGFDARSDDHLADLALV